MSTPTTTGSENDDGLEYFQWDVEGGVATITFDRPERRNGLDPDVMREFESLILRVRNNTAIRVVIVTGTGTSFCAGADLAYARRSSTEAEKTEAIAAMSQVPRIIGRVFDVIVSMDAISVCAVNGHAIGGGWSLALAFDHVISVPEADFWVPEVDLGVPFRGLANITLTERLGPNLAKEACILCRHFSAEELRELRVINEVVPADDLMTRARAVAAEYASKSPKAAIGTKRDINGVLYGQRHF